MTSMTDLTQDLVEEILSKVPITSLGAVRATCKGWNTLSKDRILCTGEPKQQFLGFTMLDHRLCSMRFNLHGILNEDGEDLVSISMYQVEISNVFYCAGLLLCVSVTRDKSSKLVVWNPYLGQIRLIDVKTETKSTYALGYDKILRFFDDDQGYYEVYDLKSNSWRDFRVIPNWDIICYRQGLSVNGNTYFWTTGDSDEDETNDFLICFDFTEERFGKFLDLPFQPPDDYEHFGHAGTLSCVKEEKLAALYQHCDALHMIEIWVTTKIEPSAVSWIPFLKVDCEPIFLSIFESDEDYDSFFVDEDYDSFFVDEEKKLAVVFSSCSDEPKGYKKAYIIGEDSYFKEVDLGEVKAYRSPLVCSSSYVPSLVQINQTAGPKKRENKKKKKKELSKNKEKKRKQNHAAIKV